jgi:type III secretory pathway component EscS
MDAQTQDVLLQAFRALFTVALPVCVVLSVAGSLVAGLQAVTSIHDSATAYTVRVLALVVLLYILLPGFVRVITSLAELALK